MAGSAGTWASVSSLMASHKSVRGRIGDLGLSDKALEGRLATYFEKYDIQEPESWTPPIATDKSWWSISFDKWTFQEELSLDKVLADGSGNRFAGRSGG
jgi:DNA phosphorothioation-dependent restriction protein DptH